MISVNNWLVTIDKNYSVNPVIFVILYLVTFLPCWFFFVKMISFIRNKNFSLTFTYGLCFLLSYLTPYIYILLFGKNLPIWVYILLSILVVASVVSFVKKLSKKMNDEHYDKSWWLWNLMSHFYNRAIKISLVHQKLFEDMYSKIDFNSGLKILDAGCGTGDFIQLIDRRRKGLDKIEAFDFSTQMVGNARKKFKKSDNVHIFQYDLSDELPFTDSEFDLIISSQVFFSLPKPVYSLKQFARVLKPGGSLIVVDQNSQAKASDMAKQQVQEYSQLRGLEKVKAYSRFLLFLYHVTGWIMMSMLVNKWIKDKNKYNEFTIDQWYTMLEEAGFVDMHYDLVLAKQSWLITARRG